MLLLVSSIALVVYTLVYPGWWMTDLYAQLFGPRPLPPLYHDVRAAELALPQHFVKDPFANGQKYLWIEAHTQCECSV